MTTTTSASTWVCQTVSPCGQYWLRLGRLSTILTVFKALRFLCPSLQPTVRQNGRSNTDYPMAVGHFTEDQNPTWMQSSNRRDKNCNNLRMWRPTLVQARRTTALTTPRLWSRIARRVDLRIAEFGAIEPPFWGSPLRCRNGLAIIARVICTSNVRTSERRVSPASFAFKRGAAYVGSDHHRFFGHLAQPEVQPLGQEHIHQADLVFRR
ncbi:hypothetical protein PhaeoP23_03853 (plasmid) [Phaeobacter piscinae]|uniref:Uncharacterized protein n=1 Tax=Phaeobacter piscinae TaxID=1580596 RepID=A0ABN5DVZ4_9RHOB|nr:hypothetical protein PhaeoP36_03853 [Phaeobacter piscinae]AUQ88450.1 hypothetical protein PhaeoP42_03854 [Phaeobacter piscinae]AUR26333.1 hypothetical protein PhaeoP23_03853 [Phaeobacter piscinae]